MELPLYNMDFIEIFPNAVPRSLCEQLISIIDLHPALSPGNTGYGVDLSKKHSLDITIDHHADLLPFRDQILAHVFPSICQYFEKYAMALMGAVSITVADENGNPVSLSSENYATLGRPRAEGLVKYLYRSGQINLQKYPKNIGGYPHWHSEQYPQLKQFDALHRVALFMLYLNDVEEGGETEFYYQQRKITPKQGSLVIAPAGFTHTHRGNIPISSDKYIATSWVQFNPAEQLYR